MTRIKTRFVPLPTPKLEAVQAVRRAALARWGVTPELSVPITFTTPPTPEPSQDTSGGFEVRDEPLEPPKPRRKVTRTKP